MQFKPMTSFCFTYLHYQQIRFFFFKVLETRLCHVHSSPSCHIQGLTTSELKAKATRGNVLRPTPSLLKRWRGLFWVNSNMEAYNPHHKKEKFDLPGTRAKATVGLTKLAKLLSIFSSNKFIKSNYKSICLSSFTRKKPKHCALKLVGYSCQNTDTSKSWQRLLTTFHQYTQRRFHFQVLNQTKIQVEEKNSKHKNFNSL